MAPGDIARPYEPRPRSCYGGQVGTHRRHGLTHQAGRLRLREIRVLLDGVAPVRLGDPEGVEYGLGAQESRGYR